MFFSTNDDCMQLRVASTKLQEKRLILSRHKYSTSTVQVIIAWTLRRMSIFFFYG